MTKVSNAQPYPEEYTTAGDKTWNTYSLCYYDSYLPQVQEGLPSAIYILPYVCCHVMDYPNRQTEKGLRFKKEVEGGKKDMKSRRRSSPYTVTAWTK
jgi:hypothetical protein